MRPNGPGENRPLRPRQGQRRGGPSRIPQGAWRERAEFEAWRTHADRNGYRAPAPGRERGPGNRSPEKGGAVLRGLSGSLAAGLVVLALGLVGVQFWQSSQGEPGPEWPAVIGHLCAAALALVLQRAADHRRDAVGVLASVGVFVIVAATLWTWWWA